MKRAGFVARVCLVVLCVSGFAVLAWARHRSTTGRRFAILYPRQYDGVGVLESAMAVFGKPTHDHPLDDGRVIPVREPVVYVWRGRLVVTSTTHLFYDFGLTFRPPMIPCDDSAEEIPDERDRLRMYVLQNFVGTGPPRGWLAPRGITMTPLMLLLAIYPGWLSFVCARRLLRTWAAGKRMEAGECAVCGYSLVGNTSGFCPECGCATGIGREINRP